MCDAAGESLKSARRPDRGIKQQWAKANPPGSLRLMLFNVSNDVEEFRDTGVTQRRLTPAGTRLMTSTGRPSPLTSTGRHSPADARPQLSTACNRPPPAIVHCPQPSTACTRPRPGRPPAYACPPPSPPEPAHADPRPSPRARLGTRRQGRLPVHTRAGRPQLGRARRAAGAHQVTSDVKVAADLTQ